MTETYDIVLRDIPVGSFEGAVYDKALEIANTIIRKQHDYGKGNIRKGQEAGIILRVSDKVERLFNLAYPVRKDGDPANESVRDSWLDVGGYGNIGLLWNDGDWDKPMMMAKPPMWKGHDPRNACSNHTGGCPPNSHVPPMYQEDPSLLDSGKPRRTPNAGKRKKKHKARKTASPPATGPAEEPLIGTPS